MAVTINLSLRDTALIVEALEHYRSYHVEHRDDNRDLSDRYLRRIDSVLNRTLDEGIPAVVDALGLKVHP